MLARPAQRTRVLVAIVVLLCAVPPTTTAHGAPRATRVLLVFQQQAEAAPMLEFTQRLRMTLRNALASPVEFYQEALDLDRFAEHSSPAARYFEDKYRGFSIDVVVPIGGRALRFTLENLTDVFPRVPVVFALGAAPQIDAAALPGNVTGRLAGPLRFIPTLAMARRLQPDAEHVVVIGGAGAADSVSVSAAISAVKARRDTLALTVLQGLSLDTMLGRLRQLPRRSIVIFANFRQDGDGQVYEPLDVIGTMARASAAPMYAQLINYVGDGVLGGSVMMFTDEGVRTGRLVARVLQRRPGERMPPVEAIPKRFVADWRQLRRWGLSEKRLPPGTQVLFREPTPWQRYRIVGLLTLGVITAESLLLGLLLIERRRRKRAQLALEQKAAYEELMAMTIRRGEELNRAVLASLSPQIAILDRRGTIIRVNTAWRDVATDAEIDVEHDAFVGWNYLEECRRAEQRGCEEAGDVRRGIEAVLERKSWPFRHEYRSSGSDDRWYEIFVDRLQHSEGGAIVTQLDITDRRLAERRAEETRRQIAHMGRVALIGELAATISHELRQPLAAIRANAEAGALLVAHTPRDAGEAREIFRSIVADDARAVEVIEGVRKLLRKEELVATKVDLNEICRDAVRLLQHDAALRGTRLELSLTRTPVMVIGDPVQLQQMVLNLALNALEAASASPTEPSVVVHTEFRVDSVEVEVHDNGPGLPSNVQPHLFESFYSTKAGGLGLGLVIVRSIVERHNGRISAENDPSGGAVFRVRLPTATLVPQTFESAESGSLNALSDPAWPGHWEAPPSRSSRK